ncbi:13390_t:CDS:10 [Funneliformis geosporum]|uniref:ubiquitinyl hydrolase 1 n=1 Tax=Funneliformis geosporum TaxID=1117311 RepID=A0A9W4WMV0_9GLOM|nr:1117_t:CDS:10 [Funneliformis geosporum]CAI2181166.1 13390_t:CDS:10 [Funneliformis geosporum]
MEETDQITKRTVYHERQSLWFCGQHTLNNLFQDKVFTKEQLDNIALKLAESTSLEGSTRRTRYINPHKSVFKVGNYDINVLEVALKEKGLEVQWFDIRKDIRTVIQFTDKTLFGLILNVPTIRYYLWRSYHWIAIKPFFKQDDEKSVEVYNLDSKLTIPEKFEDFEKDTGTQQALIQEIFSLVSKRPDTVCNFLEGSQMLGGKDTRIIYRHYATLYFVFVVDECESELGILDLIQVFVECLDRCFENVCELDLIFHFEDVHNILDEVISGGMVLETNISQIVSAFNETNKYKRRSGAMATIAGSGAGAVARDLGANFANTVTTTLQSTLQNTSSLQTQSPTALRPHSVVGCEGISSQPQSFRVIRRRQQRKNSRNNVLNPTLDNFYNILRRTEADLNVKSSTKNWLNEYESYRRQVINAEKSSVENIRPVSCFNVSPPPKKMENSRYSMQF